METEQEQEQVQLGDRVQDRVTKLTGIVVGYTEWLNGCIRITIQPQEVKDGKPVESSTFDIEQLQILDKDAVSPKPVERRTNGPMPDVSRY